MPFVSTGGSLVALERQTLYTRPQSITSYTGLTSTYEAIYRSQPNVRFVVDFVARNIAQLPIRLFRRVSERERRHERDHPFDRFLRNPNPRTTRYELIRDIVSDWLITDNAYALKAAIPGGRALVRQPPSLVCPVGNGQYPSGYRMDGLTGQPVWSFERVVHLHGYNPTGDPTGVSPIETLRRILAEDLAAGEYREQFWANHARTSSVIERPVEAPKWTPDARARFEASWAATWGGRGPGAGGTPVLDDGMTLKPGGQTAQESEYLGARKLTRAEVASAYFLSPSDVGIMEDVNNGSADVGHRKLYQDGLGPALKFLGLGFWLQLLPDFTEGPDDRDELEVIFDIEDKLRGSFIEESEATTRAVGGPWMTRAEGRAARGLPPLPDDQGADDLIVPLNVTAGGRPNPIDTRLPSDPPPPPDGTGQLARRRAVRGISRKALEAVGLDATGWAEQHAASLARFLDRQASNVLGRLAAGEDPNAAFGRTDGERDSRWDTELADDLAGLALALAPQAAEPIGERFGLVYDLDVATPWLINSARIAAETFNDVTLAGLVDAYSTPTTGALGRKDAEVVPPEPEPTPYDAARAVFGAARVRSGGFAQDRVSHVVNFARADVASQAGATTKTWIVTSPNPRASHSALSGVTIPADQRFANGARWPHDPILSAGEAAGCTCVVDFTEAPPTEEPAP